MVAETNDDDSDDDDNNDDDDSDNDNDNNEAAEFVEGYKDFDVEARVEVLASNSSSNSS